MLQVKHAADEKHKSIGTLQSSGDELKQKISNLSVRREALLAELKQVEEALTQVQQEESQLPDVLKNLQQERDVQARKALQMKKRLKLVEGYVDEDTREIEKSNHACVRYRLSRLYSSCKFFHWHLFRKTLVFDPAARTVIGT